MLAQQLIVLSMGADPEPDETVRTLHGKRSIVTSDASRPMILNLLETHRRMVGILLEKGERFISESLDFRR